MQNGTRKGGGTETMPTLRTSPGLEDIWQLHWSYGAGIEQNSAGVYIANVDDNATIAGILTAPPRQGGPGRGAAGPGAGGPPAGGAPLVALLAVRPRQAPGAAPAAGAAPAPSSSGSSAAGAPAAGAARLRPGRRRVRRVPAVAAVAGGGAAAHTPAYMIKILRPAGRIVHRHQHSQRFHEDVRRASARQVGPAPRRACEGVMMRVTKMRVSLLAVGAAALFTTVLAQQQPPAAPPAGAPRQPLAPRRRRGRAAAAAGRPRCRMCRRCGSTSTAGPRRTARASTTIRSSSRTGARSSRIAAPRSTAVCTSRARASWPEWTCW